jgi:hypothetical protein
MGNTQSMRKINFEDMQTVTKTPEIYLLINTLPLGDHQCCLIHGTVSSNNEESAINKYIKENKGVKIIIYGKNCNDDNVQKKYQQLLSLGFYNVYAYSGGLFEWLMLQDIYGQDLFPTTKLEKDILKFKACSILNISLLEN